MTGPTAGDTLYDSVPYPNAVFGQTHPDRLATIATLHGLTPAPVERCRVLELGCGDGTNLIAMACACPGSEFLGVDLAPTAVERGRQTIAALGLGNVALHTLDLRRLPGDWGPFDYILAHGLYSWVPEPVRDALMALCHRALAETGIAYISYNCQPGGHLREPIRRMCQFHVRQLQDPGEQVRQSRALVKFLAEAGPEPDLWQQLLQSQLERMGRQPDAAFYHDDLSPAHQAFYFHEFVQHAAEHQLQYLSEASLADALEQEFPARVLDQLPPLEGDTLLAGEQYRDFLRGRAFRQTLLVPREAAIDRELDPRRLAGLWLAADARPARGGLDPAAAVEEDFQGPKGAVIATGEPLAKAALLELGEAWPAWLAFPDLLEAARGRLGPGEAGQGTALGLAGFLLRCQRLDFAELHARPAPFATRLTERPRASALARHAARSFVGVPTLRHVVLSLDDPLARRTLPLLDGSRDRAALGRELLAAVTSGELALEREDGTAVADPAEAERLLYARLDACLQLFLRSGVLEP